jgi:hypothetical protein
MGESFRGKLIVNEVFKKKYFVTPGDKTDLLRILKRIIKIVILILLIKGTRLYLLKSDEFVSGVSEFLEVVTLEQLFKMNALALMFIGLAGLFVSYLVVGKSIIRTKWFNFLFLFCLIDAMFVYLFPEIPASVFKAILLNH